VQEDAPVDDAVIDLRVLIARDGTADVCEDGADPVGAAVRLPIRARTRAVGTLRLVGPGTGEWTRDDRRRLAAFADQIGVAYVTFLLRDSPGRRVTWGQVRTCAAIGVVVIGLSLVLGAAWALGARALPLAWLPSRPGVWVGTGLVATGALLACFRR
jgi:GAF domain